MANAREFSHSWLVPTTVSESDDKVVALRAELATEQSERQRIVNALADQEHLLSPDQRTNLVASLARQDKIIANLEDSAHLRALADHAVVALVPQTNADHVVAGTPLYACRLEMFWCRKVGSVIAVLPGELQFRHPHRDTQVRGRMIEIKLGEVAVGHAAVLFAGGKPLGL